jgi:hypothetical protein
MSKINGSSFLFGFGLGMVYANVFRYMINKRNTTSNNKSEKFNTNY